MTENLEVLNGQGIHDVVAVVTRYFGGTLLGTGGLVRAYSAAVKEGLKNCMLLTEQAGYKLKIRTDYNGIGKLQYVARTRELIELDTVYADRVEYNLLVPAQQKEQIEKEITEKTAGKAGLEWLEEVRYGISEGNHLEFVRLYEQSE